jgi:hypothetical protein
MLAPCACPSVAWRRFATSCLAAAWLPAELLHIHMLPDFDRVDAIGSYWGIRPPETFAELLIDCEDRTRSAVVAGVLGVDPVPGGHDDPPVARLSAQSDQTILDIVRGVGLEQ